MNEEKDGLFDRLRMLLQELTGNDAGEIHLETTFEDLGIIEETDLPRILKRLNQEFSIHLAATDVVDQAETVENLLIMINDEMELG